MAKTSRPLRLLVHPDLAETEPFKVLAAKGHVIHTFPQEPEGMIPGDVWEYDAILGPTSWRMTERHLQYLEDALKEARKRRYHGGVSKEKVPDE